ncbi:MAG: ISL3 family transposase [Nevskia sp.]|nr:ISL3 family transposase [Nevskia sp.]
MRDVDLYRQILGLPEPWLVTDVNLDLNGGRVEVLVTHPEGLRWMCPQCGKHLAVHDHAAERSWRHLDTCQLQTVLRARVPRVNCPEHGVLQVKVPWAEPRGRFTALMERWIIDVLQQCATISGACRLLRLSWDEVFGVMDRAVRRGQARKKPRVLRQIGVDEKAFRKGHSYTTIVSDIERSTIEYLADERKRESLEGFYNSLTPRQRQGIQAVAMDMWEPYITATQAQVPEAPRKIVFDRFHIMQHVGQAVDAVRKTEHRALRAAGDDTLTRTKYLWLHSQENLTDARREQLSILLGQNLKVARAWAIKEALRQLWDYHREGWARRFFARWYFWATHSRLEPIRQVAHMLKRRLDNIVTYCRLRITNAVAEGINSKLMAIKRRACGYRNPEHFKIAAYFFCGGLDLYPR